MADTVSIKMFAVNNFGRDRKVVATFQTIPFMDQDYIRECLRALISCQSMANSLRKSAQDALDAMK